MSVQFAISPDIPLMFLASTKGIEIKTIVDVNKNGSKTRTKKYFCLSLMLFFCVKNLGSSLSY
jgi:hypothetical protein